MTFLFWLLLAVVVLIAVLLLVGNFMYNFALNGPKIRKRNEDRAVRLPFELDESWLIMARPEEVTVTSHDGLKLHGYLVPQENAPYAILCHGYTAYARAMSTVGEVFAAHGYGVLLVDARAHGKSEGKAVGMGWLERRDIAKWVEYLSDRFDEPPIALYGVSMGGATVMMASGEPLPDNVKAVVEDCGYTSVWEVFEHNVEKVLHLKPFPFLTVANWITDFRAGYNMKTASALRQVHKSKTPTLFLHGGKDAVVPTSMAGRLYAAESGEKDIHIFEESEHAMSATDYGTDYWEVVFAFLNRYVRDGAEAPDADTPDRTDATAEAGEDEFPEPDEI